MNVLNEMGHGFAEKVYENALAYEFELQGLDFQKQSVLEVKYKNKLVGHYIPDFLVDNKIIVELKTVERIGNNEKGQVLNYLKATNLRVGLILNFKNAKLEWQRVVL